MPKSVYARLGQLIADHRSTLIFVNTRRMAERLGHRLRESLGNDAVASHHGSLAKELRHSAEQRLKNGELRALDARLLEETETAPDYKLFALDTTPPKPGMLRVEVGTGAAIKLELWALSAAAFGRFVAAIPPPLSIGTVRLADGRCIKGFLVEPAAIDGARDISSFGGWRAFVTRQAAE